MPIDASSPQVKELGEQGLLQKLQQFCPADVVGDDAALVAIPAGQSAVVTADMLVDGVHFSVGLASEVLTTAPADVGWRATAANLSDLAAMGADPLGITVSLGLPGETPIDWLEELYAGMAECLQRYDTVLVGGDVCRSPVLTVAIAAFGAVNPSQSILRSKAQPGDAILVTGVHGASRAGLELLLHPEQGQTLSSAQRQHLIQAHQRPCARLDVLPLLRQCGEAGMPTRVAGMDSSDGLADAVLQICRASDVGATLQRRQIPIATGIESWTSADQALEWALYGGEDFELVLCLPLPEAKALQARLGDPAAIVGTVTAETDVVLKGGDRAEDRVLSLSQGFQHF